MLVSITGFTSRYVISLEIKRQHKTVLNEIHILSVPKQEAQTTQGMVQLTLYSFVMGIYSIETARVTKKSKSKCKPLLELIMECIDVFGTKSGELYTATRL